MNTVKINFYGATDVGCVRKNNEDTLIVQRVWDDSHVLCAAIDGLGGYEGGEVAAEIARDTIVNYLSDNHAGQPGDVLDLLKQAVTEANNAIVARRAVTPDCDRMGCVLTVGLFDMDDMRLYVAHVGDSRLYIHHDGELRKLTHDHSLVGYREEQGELTEYEAMHHPLRNVVERIVGDKVHMLGDSNFIEASIFPITPRSRYIFCSDGLCDMATSTEIGDIALNAPDVHTCVEQLIDKAKDNGGKDNVTVVVMQVDEPRTEVPEKIDEGVETETHEEPEIVPEAVDPHTAPRAKHRGIKPAAALIAVVVAAIVGFGGGFLTGKASAGKQQADSLQLLKDINRGQEMIINELKDSLAAPEPLPENVNHTKPTNSELRDE